MIRRAFTMRLKPDALDQYKYYHDNIWPELVAEIERAGIGTITTFQRGLELFLVSEVRDEGAWDRLWNSPIHRRWAELMEPLMHLRDDGIVDASELTEVFHLSVGPSDNGVVTTAMIMDELSDELGADETDTDVITLEAADANGDWGGEPVATEIANQAALADALSALSAALDREYELRGFDERQSEYATMEVEIPVRGRDPLADLIADTAASTEPSTLMPTSFVPAEQSPVPTTLAPHAPRRRKVTRKSGKKKPVAKKSAKGRKKAAAKPSKRKTSPGKAGRAKKVVKKSPPKKQPTKKSAKKPGKPAKTSARKRSKRR